ncbi:MAG: haloacid dehalogenase-like hydrolase [Planctomycetaceae bacterium]|nr:haloacid dehalogenase-like hydrolase [Planctomycetales bacterium]MCB9921258.1 haloacid dehalogenase-like hydrolase [Planctomycetaceae bacterium]
MACDCRLHLVLRISLLSFCLAGSSEAQDPLPSWNEGATKDALLDFVGCAAKDGCSKYIPPAERVAVFDNDGTLWAEKPIYFQLLFAIDRVRQLAADHPEWQEQQPFKAAIEGDQKTLAASGLEGILKLVMATHAGMTTDEFAATVRSWLKEAKHPRFGRPYSELTYQPMLELLKYLRANGFKTYIVSGGGIDFLRVFAEEIYGIPPEQVVGSSIKTKFEVRDNKPTVVRLPELDFIDDKEGKPVAIDRFIGRRPVAAFGNSDGDLQMLQWTAAGDGPRLCMIIHHTDAKREWAYDRDSHVGQLTRALDEAKHQGWFVVDMKSDWNSVFAFERP